MISGVWGKKIGMTQVFTENAVIPVTLIDTAHWYVTQVKTVERDGYSSVQIGYLRKRYQVQEFSAQWLKKPSEYFELLREVRVDAPVADVVPGMAADFLMNFALGESVDVTGRSKGCGFAGVVRRHHFNGPPASHGSMMGNRPGAIGFYSTQGRVIKGKRLPGHKGNKQFTTRGLEVVKLAPEQKVVFVKGAIPGKSGSFVFMKKSAGKA